MFSKQFSIAATFLIALTTDLVLPAHSAQVVNGKAVTHRASLYRGKTFVIIGASSGFGRGVAEKLGVLGANVVVAARRRKLLDELADNIRSSGGDALVMTTDISKPDDVERLAKLAEEKYGHIDVWINDTGIGALGKFEEIPIADQARVVDVNLKGIIYGSHVAIQLFKKQGYGVLINLGSVESIVPLPYHATYAATKAAILGLDQALIQELRLSKEKNIKVSTVMPWAVDTPWWDHAANYSGGTPRMIAMDDPHEVVDAIIRDSIHPKKQVLVGWKARLAGASHRMMPGLTERNAANTVYKYQIETAPPAPPTDSSVFLPVTTGTQVNGGVRVRMKKENQAHRQNN